MIYVVLFLLMTLFYPPSLQLPDIKTRLRYQLPKFNRQVFLAKEYLPIPDDNQTYYRHINDTGYNCSWMYYPDEIPDEWRQYTVDVEWNVLKPNLIRPDQEVIGGHPRSNYEDYGYGRAFIPNPFNTNNVSLIYDYIDAGLIMIDLYCHPDSHYWNPETQYIEWYVFKQINKDPKTVRPWHVDGQVMNKEFVIISYFDNECNCMFNVSVKKGMTYNPNNDQFIKNALNDFKKHGKNYSQWVDYYNNITVNGTRKTFVADRNVTLYLEFVSIPLTHCWDPDYTPPPTPEFSPSPSFSPSPEFSPTSAFEPSQTFSPTSYFSPSEEFTSSYSFSSSQTFTQSQSFSPSQTFSQSNTFSPSQTFDPTNTFSPSLTIPPEGGDDQQHMSGGGTTTTGSDGLPPGIIATIVIGAVVATGAATTVGAKVYKKWKAKAGVDKDGDEIDVYRMRGMNSDWL